MLRRPLVCLAIMAAASLSGCYGSTEPATGIAPDHATFNGAGTTNDGPAHVFFEYWPTADPSLRRKTEGQDVPAGKTGPFSDSLFLSVGLEPATNYSFRLCATDRGVPKGACAQTRTFDTSRPSGDLVKGISLTEDGPNVFTSIDARSHADGSSPSGSVSVSASTAFGAQHVFDGSVTCLAVQGSSAVVGASGHGGDGAEETFMASVHDTGVSSSPDAVGYSFSPDPPDCAHGPALSSPPLSTFAVFDTR